METKVKNHGAEIRFSSISPTELWDRLGLAQPSDKKEPIEVFSLDSMDPEDKKIFEAFRKDCPCPMDVADEATEVIIPSNKGSLFVWALLKQCSNRSKTNKKLSSVNHLFKDDVARTARYAGKKLGVAIDELDFDRICCYLQQKHLVETSQDGIRITRQLASLFHEKYEAWLVFWSSECMKFRNRSVSAPIFNFGSNNIFFHLY